jgi:hypothetical protein
MIRWLGVLRFIRFSPVSALVICFVGPFSLAGCGGGNNSADGTSAAASGTAASSDASRYRPGDPRCRAREAPGTVGAIGENVAAGSVRVDDFVACFGPPIRRTEMAVRDCLYYRQRQAQTYWRFCVRDGRIVSALGNLPRRHQR